MRKMNTLPNSVSISVLDEEKTVKESVKIGRKYMDDLLFCQENDRNYHYAGMKIVGGWREIPRREEVQTDTHLIRSRRK